MNHDDRQVRSTRGFERRRTTLGENGRGKYQAKRRPLGSVEVYG
jgi:hypothetical protein